MKSRIISLGHAHPSQVVDNATLAPIMGFESEWVEKNTGILSRRVLGEGESVVTMGQEAASLAIERSSARLQNEGRQCGITEIKENIKTVICATNSPVDIYPSTAAKIMDLLEIKQAHAFDVQAGCTGWLYGVHLADGLAGSLAEDEYILVVGSDALSTEIHYHDRIGVLFGDGAGACLIGRSTANSGFLAFDLGSTYSTSLELKSGYEQHLNNYSLYADGQEPEFTRPRPTMNGKEVLKLSLTSLDKSFQQVFEKAGLKPEQLEHFVPHQTNVKVVEKLCQMIGFDFEKVPFTLAELGSISTAGLPTHFNQLIEGDRLKEGDLVLMCSYGAGFTWGSALFSW